MSDMPISIILRSFNEAWALRDTLAALKAQDYTNWELIVIDSGSSDGSVELIRQAAPRHFIQILPNEYQPGRVLNTGMRLSRTEVAIFLNADASPQGRQWLRPLVASLRFSAAKSPVPNARRCSPLIMSERSAYNGNRPVGTTFSAW